MHRFVQCVTLGGARLSVTYAIISLFVHPFVNFRCHSIMVRSEELAVAILSRKIKMD